MIITAQDIIEWSRQSFRDENLGYDHIRHVFTHAHIRELIRAWELVNDKLPDPKIETPMSEYALGWNDCLRACRL